MQIVHHAPAARGVSQLMYVGDVDPPGIPLAVKIVAVLAVGWLVFRRRR
jgi:hypothetical protein